MAHTEGLHRIDDLGVSLDCRNAHADGHCASEHISHEAMAEWLRCRLQQRAEFDPLRLRKLEASTYPSCLESLVCGADHLLVKGETNTFAA